MNREQRFLKHISKDKDGCWRWIGSKNGKGYGQFGVNYKHVGAHRYSWENRNGPIPNGMVVCHKCDNPACVNPDHLFLGTMKDNMLDAASKGHMRGRPKLSNTQVREIRKLFLSGNITQAKLSKDYKVDPSLISYIVNNKIWKGIKK